MIDDFLAQDIAELACIAAVRRPGNALISEPAMTPSAAAAPPR
jgi:hypothetical protein